MGHRCTVNISEKFRALPISIQAPNQVFYIEGPYVGEAREKESTGRSQIYLTSDLNPSSRLSRVSIRTSCTDIATVASECKERTRYYYHDIRLPRVRLLSLGLNGSRTARECESTIFPGWNAFFLTHLDLESITTGRRSSSRAGIILRRERTSTTRLLSSAASTVQRETVETYIYPLENQLRDT